MAAIAGGSQNELLRLVRGGCTMVARVAPAHDGPAGARRIVREHRLVRALADTDVPHARALALCEDPDVLGSAFYVMAHVDGWSPMHGGWAPPFDRDLQARAGLAHALVDGIARLALVDWRAAGLEGFGHPDGFHDRQVDRWLTFLAEYQFRPLPGLHEAAEWLRANRPRSFQAGIMHGDYQFANVLFHHGAPAALAAIVDWEMATIGDPLLDLGWALVAWPPEGDDMVHARYLDLSGMPSRDELVERYAATSGRPVDNIDYYVILARFKLAIVLERSVARAAQAPDADPRVAAFAPIVLELAAKAAELAAGSHR